MINGASLGLSYRLIQTLEQVQAERDALRQVTAELVTLCKTCGISGDTIHKAETVLKRK